VLTLPVALRSDLSAHLRFPVDLSQDEAEKLSRVVLAYVDTDRVFSPPLPSWEAYQSAMKGLDQ